VGFLLANGEEPLFMRTLENDISAVLKGKEFIKMKSTNFELVRNGYKYARKYISLVIN